jgi:lipopolysaccharide/colanic/teichoic acid biosynthesis glycosyltransferase
MLFAGGWYASFESGAIIFQQTRVGKNKRLFQMYKFRSMRVNAEEKTGWTTSDDPRKTRFGSLMPRPASTSCRSFLTC